MAKTPDPVTVQPAVQAAVPSFPPIAPTPTPENTPMPGGGRYRWDIAAPGWVDVDAPAPAQANPA